MSLIKIAVLSDTHGNLRAMEQMRGIFAECDYIVHLGDGAREMKFYFADYGEKIYQVDGNCDAYGSGLKEFILEIGKFKILLTHGHLFNVKTGTERLVDYAIENGCNAVFYGHTHKADVSTVKGVTVVNPGTFSFFSMQKSFAYVVINDDKMVATINNTLIKQ